MKRIFAWGMFGLFISYTIALLFVILDMALCNSEVFHRGQDAGTYIIVCLAFVICLWCTGEFLAIGQGKRDEKPS